MPCGLWIVHSKCHTNSTYALHIKTHYRFCQSHLGMLSINARGFAVVVITNLSKNLQKKFGNAVFPEKLQPYIIRGQCTNCG